MSLKVYCDTGSMEFFLSTDEDTYGYLYMPDGRLVPRSEACALARWILAGGDFGLDEDWAMAAELKRDPPHLRK